MTSPEASSPPSVPEVLARWEEERGLRGAEHRAVYVSTPITTGRRFVEWYRDRGGALREAGEEEAYRRAHRSEVMLPNMQAAARYLELLRWRNVGLVIDPNSLDVPGWGQDQYHEFWSAVLERQARRALFLDGWEFSRGCTIEFELAQRVGIDCVDQRLAPLGLDRGIQLLEDGIAYARDGGVPVEGNERLLERLRARARAGGDERTLYKDEVLDRQAELTNVAQFVSFAPGPDLAQRYARVTGHPPNHVFDTAEAAVGALLASAPEGRVNIRTFDPRRPEGNPFERDLETVAEVLDKLRGFAEQGLHTIVNEVVEPSDGGVSGVAHRGILEFAPDATPRVVDDPDVVRAILPFEIGMGVLARVYGFEPDLRGREGARVEFTVSPGPRGWAHAPTLIWQSEQRPMAQLAPRPSWPNVFSRMVGDKTYGLLVADAAGLPVPRTVAYTERLFPFEFGTPAGGADVWIRTCPEIKWPGYYPSAKGWADPYRVLADPWILEPDARPSTPPPEETPPVRGVLAQEGVPAVFSGRLLPTEDGFVLEGVQGEGEEFMKGDQPSAEVPSAARDAVEELYDGVRAVFGPATVEWAYDGAVAWLLQVTPAVPSGPADGEAASVEWEEFVYTKGSLERFREKVRALVGTGRGVLVRGNVSPLSHAGEIADSFGVPARFVGGSPGQG